MTPGCRSVLNFLTAFLARGSAERLAVMSNEKMLQLEPSSYITISVQACCIVRTETETEGE